MKKEKRWYDENPELRKLLEKLKKLEKYERDVIFEDIKKLDDDFDSKLIDRHVMEFPMNLRRRWYDRDPYSWLVINGLKYADDVLLAKVIVCLKEKLL